MNGPTAPAFAAPSGIPPALDVPLCIHCRFYRPDPSEPDQSDGWCWRFAEANPVNGKDETHARCKGERQAVLGRCGPSGVCYLPQPRRGAPRSFRPP